MCTMQGWQVTRQCHLMYEGGVRRGPLVDLRCSGEGTRRSHTGEGSAFWAAGVRDSMPIFTCLVTFSIFLALCLFTFLSLKCMGMGNCICVALDNHRV